MNLKKGTAAALCTLFLLEAAGCGGQEKKLELEIIGEGVVYEQSQTREPLPYGSYAFRGMGEDVMPVGGFLEPMDMSFPNGVVMPSLARPEVLEAIAEAGVNWIIGVRTNLTAGATSAATELLEMAGAAGIAVTLPMRDLIECSQAQVIRAADYDTIKTALEQVGKYSAFAGIYGQDEPYGAVYTQAADFNRALRRAAAETGVEATTYWNAWPSSISPYNKTPDGIYVLSGTNKRITYEEHIDLLVASEPDFVMFDRYPFENESVQAEYFFNLSTVRKKAFAAGLPYYSFVQAGGLFGDSKSHRLPTEGEFLWNVNTLLGYGVKGLAYFPLIFPPEWADLTEFGNNGLVDPYGSKNLWWHYAKKASAQIAAADEYLMRSAHVGLIAHGESPVTVPADDLLGDGWRELTGVSGDNALVGCFDYMGKTALYVVNNDIGKDGAHVTLSFDKKYGYDVIQRAESVSVAGTEIPLVLNAGEGALIVLK